MNKNKMTRKDAVLELLMQNINVWIDGPRIASPEVGGSEGLKRLRELREEGHKIENRRHPNKDRDVWQYRLVGKEYMIPGTWSCSRCSTESKEKPVTGSKASLSDKMIFAGCYKCRRETIWRYAE
jgi:hypothetical protein